MNSKKYTSFTYTNLNFYLKFEQNKNLMILFDFEKFYKTHFLI